MTLKLITRALKSMTHKCGLFGAALFVFLTLPAMANAAVSVSTADLNMRSGPNTSFGVIAVIPEGDEVEVFGCVQGYSWCDVAWAGFRGWSYSEFLANVDGENTTFWVDYAPRVSFPVVAFSYFAYHDRWYRKRPWYRKRRYAIRRDRFLRDIRRGRYDARRRPVRRATRIRLRRDRDRFIKVRRNRNRVIIDRKTKTKSVIINRKPGSRPVIKKRTTTRKSVTTRRANTRKTIKTKKVRKTTKTKRNTRVRRNNQKVKARQRNNRANRNRNQNQNIQNRLRRN